MHPACTFVITLLVGYREEVAAACASVLTRNMTTVATHKGGLHHAGQQGLVRPALRHTWSNFLAVLQDLDGQKE